ncbi:hypothetical protein RISW2_22255 [Roseivivax isoporae LMG 25204]|uniref:Uncharacterized protein n=1 Tax=Roseivivax isoporae LMG 25204 TaxID=1449351 RepID=X7FCD4_9RHOB|nr:hypothetical protein RISW2_22255 [Roseivivax isoporae LMG 25204]
MGARDGITETRNGAAPVATVPAGRAPDGMREGAQC